MADRFFPNEALPDLIHLMYTFSKGVEGQIADFKRTEDYETLASVVAMMGKDLVLYIKNFDVIYQDAETPEELQQLETLAKLLGEAKNLMVKASRLLKEEN